MNKNVKVSNPMKVITGPDTRWSYANVWEPKSINGGTPMVMVVMVSPPSGMPSHVCLVCIPATFQRIP